MRESAGKVAEGSLDLLKHLPHEFVKAEDLPALVSKSGTSPAVFKARVHESHTPFPGPDVDLHKIYIVHTLPQDYFVRKDGLEYSREHYYAHPDAYESVFHTKVRSSILILHISAILRLDSDSHPRLRRT